MIEAVPEFADGGYWYAIPAVPSIDAPGWSFGDMPGCAWYSEIAGVVYCTIRVTAPISGLPVADPVSVTDILSSGSKPFARIGGV